MPMERLVRRAAVGSLLAAGGVVLASSAAAADDAPAAAATPAALGSPINEPVVQAGAAPGPSVLAAQADVAVARAKGARPAPVTTAVKPVKRPAQPATGRPRPAPVSEAAAAPGRPRPPVQQVQQVQQVQLQVQPAAPGLPPAVPVTRPRTWSRPAPPLAIVSLAIASAPVAPPAGAPGSLATLDPIVSPPPVTGAAAGPEVASGPPVAGAPPPPPGPDGSGSSPANLAEASTAGAVHPAAVTGSLGPVTITIDQPLPGTLVAPGTSVLVTGTVTINSSSLALNIIYVVDTSSGSSAPVPTSTTCGDANGDGAAGTVLDCEIVGIADLNAAFGTEDVKVSLVTFGGGAVVHDLSPAPGSQTAVLPASDANGNGVADVVDVLLTLQSGGSASFDSALAAVQGLLVTGEQNIVFFLSGGSGTLTTGPGTPLQAVHDSGASVIGVAIGDQPPGSMDNPPVCAVANDICYIARDPVGLGVLRDFIGLNAINHVEIDVGGFIDTAHLTSSGTFSFIVPADALHPGRNTIVVRALPNDALAFPAEVATFVRVGGSQGVSRGGGSALLDLGPVSATSPTALAGILPVTGLGTGHRAATGALSFLLGGLFLGGARHLRRRRRTQAVA